MFKKNTKHQQPALISAISDLPEKQRQPLQDHGVTLIQTALRGAQPNPEKLGLTDFDIQHPMGSKASNVPKVSSARAGRLTATFGTFAPRLCKTGRPLDAEALTNKIHSKEKSHECKV